jgi:hypothetical protein
MNRAFISCTGIALTLSILTGVVVKHYSDPDAVETFGEKTEWSLLQVIEQQERNRPLKDPVIRVVDGSEILGVQAINGKNIWILLNVQSPPYYKQMPNFNYEVSSAFVDQLVKTKRLSYTVVHVLRAHVSNP